jgi:hypothetical protein
MKALIDIVDQMKHNKLNNYILAGLSSSILGGGDFGCVRLFESSRYTEQFVTPHSHRFDFFCFVLQGFVENIVYQDSESDDDTWSVFEMQKLNGFGQYKNTFVKNKNFLRQSFCYEAGEFYSMTADEIHSIKFSKDSKVLFFEGAEKSNKSFYLEPFVNEKTINVFEVKPWMFEHA